MSKFLLTAQLQLQPPTNTRQVVSQMRRQLQNVNVQVKLQKAIAAQKQLQTLNKQTNQLNSAGQRLGKTFGVAVKRFAAFSVASRAVTLFTTGLADATREAIAFERELIKISQVTGKSIEQLSGLNNTITQLSVGLGTSSKDLLATTRILAQAGIQANELDVALTALAKTTLAPTFDDITKTAEGAVAILAQFGKGVVALEQQLGAISAVAGQFAVESGDLISVVRRTGGVFKAAGGELEELIALFTSVRATTRESAESIATGLRTIFTRIQRPKTIEFLKQFGVELLDLNGKFIGPYEAVRQLSDALTGLGEGDIRFVQIAEELGGFRQIGKVIPLLQEFETAERARQAALKGGDSLTKDAATAQQALAVQITKVKEEFLALVRSFSQTASFQIFVKTALDLASALIKVADALTPIIPLMTAFVGFKLARGIGSFGAGLGAGLRGAKGFNAGGVVPGTGNRDTVPAMLTPGEFVIRKSSVKKIGAANLAAMNAKGYNGGGKVEPSIKGDVQADKLPSIFNSQRVVRKKINFVGNVKDPSVQFNQKDRLRSDIKVESYPTIIPPGFQYAGQRLFPRMFERLVALKLTGSVRSVGAAGNTNAIDLPTGSPDNLPTEIRRVKTRSSPSELIDKLIRSFAQQGVPNSGQKQLTGKINTLQLAPMKVAYGDDRRQILAADAARIGLKRKKQRGGRSANFFGGNIPKYATGGPAPSDTVPALLTPGEFVINKKSATKIGRANLDRMNKFGVKGFAAGGVVTPGRSLYGDLPPLYSGSGNTTQLSPPRGKSAAQRDPLTKERLAVTKEEKKVTKKKRKITDLEKKALEEQNKRNEARANRPNAFKRATSAAFKPFSTAFTEVGKRFTEEGRKQLNERKEQRTKEKADNKEKIKKERANTKAQKQATSSLRKNAALNLQEVGKKPKAGQKFGALREAVRANRGAEGPSLKDRGVRNQNQRKNFNKGRGGGKLDGLGVFFAAQALSSMIPQVEGATEGFGAVQNEIGPLIMQVSTLALIVQSLGLKMGTLGTGLLAGAAAAYAVVNIMDAYTGVHKKAKKAVEEGDVANAGRLAGASQAQKDLNLVATGAGAVGGLAGAAIGTAIAGPLGTVAGGMVGAAGGAAIGAAVKTMIPESTVKGFRNFMSEAFGTKSVALIEANATAAAAANLAEKNLAENSEKAADALKEVESGSKSLAEVFESGVLTQSITEARRSLNAARSATSQAKRDETSGVNPLMAGGAAALIGGAIGAGIGSFFGGVGAIPGYAIGAGLGTAVGGLVGFGAADSAKERSEQTTKEAQAAQEEQQKLFNQRIKEIIPSLNKMGKEIFRAGGSFSDFTSFVSGAIGQTFETLSPENQIKLATAFRNNAIAVAENTKAFARINLGLRPLESFGASINLSLDRTLAILDGSFNPLKNSLSTVEAALTGAAVSTKDYNNSLDSINESFRSFGVSEAAISKLNENFNTLRIASNGYEEAIKKAREEVLAGGGDVSGLQVKDKIIEELSNLSGLSDEGKLIIKDIFSNIDLNQADVDDLSSGDISSILEKLDEAGTKAFEKTKAAGERLVSAQDKLKKITDERIKAEQRFIDAQKRSIDILEEAAEASAKASGRQLTLLEKENFERDRLAANLGGGLGSTGSPADIRNKINQIVSDSAAASSRIRGSIGGPDRDNTNDRNIIAKAATELDSLTEYTRKRIKLYEDELDIVQKKNSLEKSALEKLISGDTLGFIKAQEAAAAQSALLRGDTSAASQFSSAAIGEALSNLSEQALSDSERRLAAATALGPAFASQANISALSGVSGEESAIRQAIQEQANVLKQIAPAVKRLGSQEFEIYTQALQQSNLDFINAQKESTAAMRNFAEAAKQINNVAEEQAGRAAAIKSETDAIIERNKKILEVQKEEATINAERVNINMTGRRGSSSRAARAGVPPTATGYSMGGTVYASRGMFIPRGTDTVPAMLTPGEFVVNRAAVQRGNNLQVLKAMNNNSSAPAEGMSRGGVVYRRWGSKNPETATGGGMDMSQVFKTFESSSKMFSDAVNKLVGFKLNIQLDPANVNVNINGGTFLQTMKENLKEELLSIISERIKNANQDFTGDINMDPYTQRIV